MNVPIAPLDGTTTLAINADDAAENSNQSSGRGKYLYYLHPTSAYGDSSEHKLTSGRQ